MHLHHMKLSVSDNLWIEQIKENITPVTTMGEVNPSAAFVLAPEHRPKSSVIIAEGIPLIDLSPINYQDEGTIPVSIDGLVKEIGSACKEWGFFQVINHKVPLDKRERIEEAARKFFALSLEEKLKVRRDAVNLLGYFEAEHTKNVRDWKEIYDFNVQQPTFIPPSVEPHDEQNFQFKWDNRWPQNPPEFREACEEYAREVEKLAYKLMELIALSLGLVPNRFRDFFRHNTSNIRLNHYPPCPYPHLALGLGRHKDTGVLTVLAQDDVGGLEVRRKSDGEWIRVNPIFNSFIINVGDMIQVWSNDTYESVEHRVTVNSERDRFSIPFFLKPALYTDVKPLEELTDDSNPPKYSPINWGKFRTTRMQSNFAKSKVENLQIYHFKASQ